MPSAQPHAARPESRGSGAATIDLNVTGMTCAACQANVTRALKRQPGVAEASVNLMTGQAHVIFDPSVVEPHQLISAGVARRSSARETSPLSSSTRLARSRKVVPQ